MRTYIQQAIIDSFKEDAENSDKRVTWAYPQLKALTREIYPKEEPEIIPEWLRLMKIMRKINPKAVTLSDFDDCLSGIAFSLSAQNAVLVYSQRMILNKLLKTITLEKAQGILISILRHNFGEFSPIILADSADVH